MVETTSLTVPCIIHAGGAMTVVFRLATPEEIAKFEAAAWKPTRPIRQQMQCVCGRFVKAETFWSRGPDVTGMRSWGWHCSRCGDMIERT